MGNSAGKDIGNFFKNDITGSARFLEGGADILFRTPASLVESALTGSAKPLVSDIEGIANAYGEGGMDYYDAVTGKDKNFSQINLNPPDASERIANSIAKARAQAANPNAWWNKVDSTSISGAVQKTYYGKGGGMNGVTSPDQVAAISNPNVKVLTSATRGAQRNAVQSVGKIASLSVPAPQVGPSSKVNNSAGTQGSTTSMDVGQQAVSMKNPNT